MPIPDTPPEYTGRPYLEIAKERAADQQDNPVAAKYADPEIAWVVRVLYELAALKPGGRFRISYAQCGKLVNKNDHAGKWVLSLLMCDGTIRRLGRDYRMPYDYEFREPPPRKPWYEPNP